MLAISSRSREKASSIAILGLAVFITLIVFKPTLFLAGALPAYDARGHLFKAIHWAHTFSPWITNWHGGFAPMSTYPPLVTYLLGIFSLMMNPILAMRLLMLALLIAPPFASYTFLRRFGLDRIHASLGGLLTIVIHVPFSFGADMIYRIGLLPHGLGIIIGIVLLGRLVRDVESPAIKLRSVITTGIMWALLILTHTFSTYWVGFAAIFLVLSRSKENPHASHIIIGFLIGLLLSAYWWVSFGLNLSNMDKIHELSQAEPMAVVKRTLFLKNSGGWLSMPLVLFGFYSLRKSTKNLAFFGMISAFTFAICLNLFNAYLPFGDVLKTSQRIRLEGFLNWILLMTIPFGLANLPRKLNKNAVLSIILTFLIAGAFGIPKLKFLSLKYSKPVNNSFTQQLDPLYDFLKKNLKPGEFILTEFSWETFNTLGNPHYVTQNLAIKDPSIWELTGSFPESTKGSRNPVRLSRLMDRPSIFLSNLDLMRQRGVRYIITTLQRTRELISESNDITAVWSDKTFTVFEIKNFQTPFGFPPEIAQRIKTFSSSLSGDYHFTFSPPLEAGIYIPTGISFHPWLNATANGEKMGTINTGNDLLTLEKSPQETTDILIRFNYPPIIYIFQIISGLSLLGVILLWFIPLPQSFNLNISFEKLIKPTMAILLVLFSFLLFHNLGERPMHNDEGVNAWFFERLVEKQEYKYNPENYHGPTLYYIQKIPTAFGLKINRVSIRSGVATMGILFLLGLLFAHVQIGWRGAITAFILAGLSVNFIFYARYFIHEIPFLFFSLGLYLSLLYLQKTNQVRFYYLAWIMAVFIFCTKETSVLVFGTLGISFYMGFKKPAFKLGPHLFIAPLIGMGIWASLFSSFGSNWRGLVDSFGTYGPWIQEGWSSKHDKPFLYYLNHILIKTELPLCILSVVGMALAIQKRDRPGLFLSTWTATTFLIYSYIPYKTPWLVLNILLPMFLLAGYAVQKSWDLKYARIILVMLSVFLLGQIPKTFKTVYAEYDNPQHPQVYSHTSRDVFRLLADIDKLNRHGLPIDVLSDQYWPLPFYLKKYSQVGFHGKIIDAIYTPFVIVRDTQADDVQRTTGGRYIEFGTYQLRPKVRLKLLVEKGFSS